MYFETNQLNYHIKILILKIKKNIHLEINETKIRV